ncbi:helicase-like transcription factor CHR28 isoform X2 [Magnolia sinica]|uniref:helicase-like transcription factor CHR28 isoform X2 n=1 Tax=Magnolia sinica TaxID=86752 RepID=UPI0026596454|nr:helicase-like transcription factor CHR28 isoform X2 [Magnolia sinica]
MRPLLTKPSFNSTRNERKSNGRVKISAGRTQDLIHPVVRSDDPKYAAENGNEGELGDCLYIDNADGTTCSDNTHDHRHLPISFMNEMPAIEISGSDFGKKIQSVDGGEYASSGSQCGSVLVPQPNEHVQVQPGSDSDLGLDGDGIGKDRGHARFQLHKDLVPEPGKKPSSQHILRTLPSSFQPPVSTAKSKASVETGRVRTDKDGGHAHFQLYGGNVSEFDKNRSTRQMLRSLPTSLQSAGLATESKALTGTGGDGNDEDRVRTHFQLYRELVPEVDKKPSSEQMLRRVLHPLQPTMSTTQSKASMGTGVNGRETNEVIIHQNAATRRLLPPSLMQGRSVNHSWVAGLSNGNTAQHSGVVEEGPMENNERLVFQAALQDLAQSKLEASLPDGLLSVPLLRHQRIALAWMLQKESASLHCLGGILADDQGLGKTISTIALIQMQRPVQSKSTSDDLSQVKTEALNLDEDDRATSEFWKVKKIGKHEDFKYPTSRKGRPAAGTLVVCPASVLRQWARELDEKVTDDAKLSVLVYHGGTRTKDPVELARYDVVLTTYSIVSKEVPKQPLADDDDGEQIHPEKFASSFTNQKRKKTSTTAKKGKKKSKKGFSSVSYNGGLVARVGWFRVVLDEAQTIKNHRTQVARACCGLRAKRRWCLSGTPIQNAIDDLYSYFRFLKYDPYAVYSSFYSSIKFPISRDASSGYKKLQAILKTIMLRRTKGTLLDGEPIIQLPPKEICLKRVDFSATERHFYSQLEADSRSQFKEYAAAGTVNQNYANILLMLLRLRQACDHPHLVKGYNSDSVGKALLETARKLPREMVKNLLNLLQASLAICGVCSDPPEDAVVTTCGHVFCYQCVSEHLIGDDNLCPIADCKEQLGNDAVFSRAILQSCILDELDNNATSSSRVVEKFAAGQSLCSSKIGAAMEILHSVCKFKNPSSTVSCEGCKDVALSLESTYDRISEQGYSNGHAKTDTSFNSTVQSELPDKAIVFSQWTCMLDLLEISLNQSCIQYRRLDGRMSLASRDRAVKDFTADPEVTVMIMSLKAGNLGLNMVAACHIILLDPWWNPTTEDQAIDRAHRIGQTRTVTVSRLTIKDTVEDRILALQDFENFLPSADEDLLASNL